MNLTTSFYYILDKESAHSYNFWAKAFVSFCFPFVIFSLTVKEVQDLYFYCILKINHVFLLAVIKLRHLIFSHFLTLPEGRCSLPTFPTRICEIAPALKLSCLLALLEPTSLCLSYDILFYILYHAVGSVISAFRYSE